MMTVMHEASFTSDPMFPVFFVIALAALVYGLIWLVGRMHAKNIRSARDKRDADNRERQAQLEEQRANELFFNRQSRNVPEPENELPYQIPTRSKYVHGNVEAGQDRSAKPPARDNRPVKSQPLTLDTDRRSYQAAEEATRWNAVHAFDQSRMEQTCHTNNTHQHQQSCTVDSSMPSSGSD